MAEAGFFYSGTSDDDDSATCFVCAKVLDGWESFDDPWKEHLKHAPNCQFVKLHHPEEELTVSFNGFAIVRKKTNEETFQVEQFLNLAVIVVKNFTTQAFTKRMAAVKSRVEEITTLLKNQQL